MWIAQVKVHRAGIVIHSFEFECEYDNTDYAVKVAVLTCKIRLYVDDIVEIGGGYRYALTNHGLERRWTWESVMAE